MFVFRGVSDVSPCSFAFCGPTTFFLINLSGYLQHPIEHVQLHPVCTGAKHAREGMMVTKMIPVDVTINDNNAEKIRKYRHRKNGMFVWTFGLSDVTLLRGPVRSGR